MKKLFVASDLHLNPGEAIPPVAIRFAEMAKAEKAHIVFAGDMFNLLPYGARAWHTVEGQRTISSFMKHFRLSTRLAGNHDPFGFGLNSEYELLLGNNLILHGHQFTEWQVLQHFAPWFVEFMVRRFPKQWYTFSKRAGWIPSRYRTDIPGKEMDKYQRILSLVWARAMAEAQKRNVRIIHGHTHHVMDWHTNTEVWDCGDLRDGSFVRISQKNVISRGWVTEKSPSMEGSMPHSKCCNAAVLVSSGEGGTNFYICEGCGKPCDVAFETGGLDQSLNSPTENVTSEAVGA